MPVTLLTVTDVAPLDTVAVMRRFSCAHAPCDTITSVYAPGASFSVVAARAPWMVMPLGTEIAETI